MARRPRIVGVPCQTVSPGRKGHSSGTPFQRLDERILVFSGRDFGGQVKVYPCTLSDGAGRETCLSSIASTFTGHKPTPSGWHTLAIKEQLGHALLETTMIYIHTSHGICRGLSEPVQIRIEEPLLGQCLPAFLIFPLGLVQYPKIVGLFLVPHNPPLNVAPSCPSLTDTTACSKSIRNIEELQVVELLLLERNLGIRRAGKYLFHSEKNQSWNREIQEESERNGSA